MNYSISYSNKVARIDYCGDISAEDIREAHFSLSGDARFYECRNLILNVSQCSLEKVSTKELQTVIATDLGASNTVRSMKVAFIATDPVNIARVSEFIEKSKISPWDMKLFTSNSDVDKWLKFS